MSALGLGCNNFGGRLDAGVTLFDTADVYPMGVGGASEVFLGAGLAERHKNVVLATKFGMKMDEAGVKSGGSRRYIVAAIEASLKRLNTDWIDLLQFHAPDADTPIDETLAALDDLIRVGKIRYIGSSNFSAWQLVEAQYAARELGSNRFIVTQEGYSMLTRGIEAEVIPVCQKYGLGVLPYFPLESGVLTGKYSIGQAAPAGTRLATSPHLADQFMTSTKVAKASQLDAIAKAAGLGLNDLAFAWLLRDALVPSVIAGVSNAAQIDRNAQAMAAPLGTDLLAKIGACLNDHSDE
ncbi:MAG: aryl-alcohol dehydrogenase-like predicted oxidoreductase [Paracoccaceae bacterium]